MNSLTYGSVECAQYPLTIFTPWFRNFFTFVVPLAGVNYFPILFILGKQDPLGSPIWFQCLAPGLGFVFLFISRLFWRLGLRFYSSTGS